MRHLVGTAFDVTAVAALVLAAALWLTSNPDLLSVSPRQDALGDLRFSTVGVSWMPLNPSNNWRQLMDEPRGRGLSGPARQASEAAGGA